MRSSYTEVITTVKRMQCCLVFSFKKLGEQVFSFKKLGEQVFSQHL